MMNTSIEHFIFKKYKSDIKTFVETGTFTGGGIMKALECGYENIYSCDINPDRVTAAKEMYKDHVNIHIETNTSPVAIENFLKEIDERCVFWLDGHSMPNDMANESRGFGDDTVREGFPPCPLVDEIKVISQHHIKDHVILIDDIQCFGTWMFEGLTFDEIRKQIEEINNYGYETIGNCACFSVGDE